MNSPGKIIVSSFLLATCSLLVACKTNEAPKILGSPAEYIITHQQPATEQQLMSVLEPFIPYTVQSSTKRMTLIKFSVDPGLEKLQYAINSSDLFDTVQPNFRYQKLH